MTGEDAHVPQAAEHLQDGNLLPAWCLLLHQSSGSGVVIMYPCPAFESQLLLRARSAVLQTCWNTGGTGPALYRQDSILGTPVQVSLKQHFCSLSEEKT